MNCLSRIRLMSILLLLVSSQLFGAPSFITDGMAIAAYGTDGAYLITHPNGVYGDLYRWNAITEEWVHVANLTPKIRQMDCVKSGDKLTGTDTNKVAKLWSGILGYASPWSSPRGGTKYDWIGLDHVSEETRGLLEGFNGWETWNKPTLQFGEDWNKYLPTEPCENDRMKNFWLIDRDLAELRYKRWERDDINHLVALNRGGTDNGKPFYIYAFSDDEDFVLSRITDPPINDRGIDTHNIDEVVVRQISYDEDHQNMWCVDVDGIPWQWDNVRQEWIKRDVRSEETFIQEPPAFDVPQWLKEECRYYVRVNYVEGDYKPILLIFRETHEMHLYLGELSRSDMDSIEIVLCDPPRRDHKFHNIELNPSETPQKIVRIDGGKRIRENHHLERLLINNGIIADEDQIGVYPVIQRIVRR